MMKPSRPFILSALLLGLAGTAPAFAGNPHEISSERQAVDCAGCHVEKPATASSGPINSKNHAADLAAFKKDGVAMCSGCHDKENGHKVGIKLDFDAPADMPLDAKHKMTCLTCHYAHGSLGSNRPQASVSFMDRMLDSERLHKSFLLRRNNSDGELCLTCHEIKEGAQ
jgi:hypothetical protein